MNRPLETDDAEAVQRITRDPVVLDFVQLTDGAKERDLEGALLVDLYVGARSSRMLRSQDFESVMSRGL